MEVTVEELLRIPLLKGSSIIAGKGGRSRVIKELSLMDGYVGYLYLEKDMLAITSGYLLSREPEKVPELLRNMEQRGISGITLKIKYFGSQLPEELVRTADELNFPIIQLYDDEMKFYKLFEYFNVHIYSRKIDAFLRRDKISATMINAIHVGGPLELVKQLYTWTGKPASVVLQGALFCYPARSTGLNQALAGNDMMRFCSPVAGHDALSQFKSSSASGLGISFKYNFNESGGVWFDEEATRCDDNDIALLYSARTACEIGAAQIFAHEQDESLLKANFIEDLIGGNLQSINKAVLMTQQLNWRIPKAVQILLVQCQDLQDSYQQMEQVIEELFSLQGLSIIVCLHEHSLVVLLPQGLEDKAKLMEMMEARLAAGWPGKVFHFALGRMLDFRKARTSYQQACLAMKIKPLLSQRSRYISFDEIGVYRLCNSEEPVAEVRSFCQDILKPLIETDKDSDIDLIRTLKVFFHCRFNYSRTGQELFIHPNTVRYRLEVVERLCGISLDNYDDALSLQVALQLQPVLFPSSPT